MAFFIFFLVAGIVMYILDFLWLKLSGEIKLISFLSSGCAAGILVGFVLKTIYGIAGPAWIFVPIITLSGSFILYLFTKYNLYEKSFFKLFSTIFLGFVTGLFSLIVFKLLMIMIPSQTWSLSQSAYLLLDLIIYGFVLHFSYAFTGRIFQKNG